MSKVVQLRDVPDDLHQKLEARAELAGLSLSEYLLEEVRRIVERPTLAEMKARLARRTSVDPSPAPAQAVREERDRE